MKYDDASWHYGGDFPEDLPPSAGSTHIAIFLAWAALNGLCGSYHSDECSDDIDRLKSRSVTPTEWFSVVIDDKLTHEDLNEEGNAFANSYYGDGNGLHGQSKSYLNDYQGAFPEVGQLYAIPATWESFDRMAPLISRRFAEWRTRQRRKPWFRF